MKSLPLLLPSPFPIAPAAAAWLCCCCHCMLQNCALFFFTVRIVQAPLKTRLAMCVNSNHHHHHHHHPQSTQRQEVEVKSNATSITRPTKTTTPPPPPIPAPTSLVVLLATPSSSSLVHSPPFKTLRFSCLTPHQPTHTQHSLSQSKPTKHIHDERRPPAAFRGGSQGMYREGGREE